MPSITIPAQKKYTLVEPLKGIYIGGTKKFIQEPNYTIDALMKRFRTVSKHTQQILTNSLQFIQTSKTN
jgi:hypothetical protein